MAKIYTAQEMRHRAYEEEIFWCDHVTAAMLRQAAADLDREKKYEYAEKKSDGRVVCVHDARIEDVAMLYDGSTIVRREVGEWEEVEDGE